MNKLNITSIAKDITGEMKDEQKKITSKRIREIIAEGANTSEGIREIVKYIDNGGEVAMIKSDHIASAKVLSDQLFMRKIPYAVIRFNKGSETMFVIKDKDKEAVKQAVYNVHVLMGIITNTPNEKYKMELTKHITSGGRLSNILLYRNVSKEQYEKNLQHYNIPYALIYNKELGTYNFIIKEIDEPTAYLIQNQLSKRLN